MRSLKPRQGGVALALAAMCFATAGIHIVHPFFHAQCQGHTAARQHDGHGCASPAHSPSHCGLHSSGRRPDASLGSDDATRWQRLHGHSTCPVCQLLAGTFKMACQMASSDGLAGLSALPKAGCLVRPFLTKTASPLTFWSRAPPFLA